MEVQLSNYQVLKLTFGIKRNFISSLQNTFHSNEKSLFIILKVGTAKLSLLPLKEPKGQKHNLHGRLKIPTASSIPE